MKNTNGLVVNAHSDAGSFTSDKLDSNQWYTSSFMAYFSENTAAGTIQLQFSNDPPMGQPAANFTPVNWANVPGSTATATIVAGASGVVYTPSGFCARWLRVAFTRTGGAGTFSVSYNAIGA